MAGRLSENLMRFARTLRAAGLPLGPGDLLTALEAVTINGIQHRDDLYWTLHAVFVKRHDQTELFDQAFFLFWRNPKLLGRVSGLTLPGTPAAVERAPDAAIEINQRLLEALARESSEESEQQERVEHDGSLTWSRQEVLRTTDFEKMSMEELQQARRAIADLRLPLPTVPTRRFQRSSSGVRSDPRASLRAALRTGSDSIPLRWRKPRRRPPSLVMLCDISGSMSRYSRMLLHFMHALTNDRDRVETFLFGTRLTYVTRALRNRDVDLALDRITEQVPDWSGGTRIGGCMRAFNQSWSRRVLGQGALVLFVSDGLDREDVGYLGREMERLRKSCRRLIWLNPLLRYAMYEARAQGARAILPHVDEFRPVHNLASLEDLAVALSRRHDRRDEAHDRQLAG